MGSGKFGKVASGLCLPSADTHTFVVSPATLHPTVPNAWLPAMGVKKINIKAVDRRHLRNTTTAAVYKGRHLSWSALEC